MRISDALDQMIISYADEHANYPTEIRAHEDTIAELYKCCNIEDAAVTGVAGIKLFIDNNVPRGEFIVNQKVL